MKVTETHIQGLYIIEPKVFGDHRGYFLESYNQALFDQLIGPSRFIQDNESKSVRGVLRGLHFQLPPFDQAKLVRVVSGEVLDVAVDLRKNSSTFGQHVSVVLNDVNKQQFFIPRGFAHGFVVLSESAIFSYKVDNNYSPESEVSIRWNDPELGIDWGIAESELILSEKDSNAGFFKQFTTPF